MHRFVILLLSIAIVSCSKPKVKVERGIYYWKSSERYLKDSENELIENLKITKLYLKLFEVAKDDELGPIPISKNHFIY